MNYLEASREASPHPDYLDGYTERKRAFDRGDAGIWTSSVSEIVRILEDGLSN